MDGHEPRAQPVPAWPLQKPLANSSLNLHDATPTDFSADAASGSFTPTGPPPDAHHLTKAENIPPAAAGVATAAAEDTPLPDSTTASVMEDGMSIFDDKHADSLAERAVREHLQDLESSFVPPISPLPAITANGFDDTYLFDSPIKKSTSPAEHRSQNQSPTPTKPALEAPGPASEIPMSLSVGYGNPALSTPLSPSPTPSARSRDAKQAPAEQDESLYDTRPRHDAADTSATTESLEAFSSSPTAAAAARTISRALSTASIGKTNGGDADTSRIEGNTFSTGEPSAMAESSLNQAPAGSNSILSPGSNALPKPSRSSRKSYIDAGSTPGHALRVGGRPKYLRSRQTSQRSSVSSVDSNDSSHDDRDSDVTVGAGTDYALQSGGALPALGVSRGLSRIMSRSISMGSIASGIDDHETSGRALETLDEDSTEMNRFGQDLLQTPKASRKLAPPTDTVINNRVMNVQVPESLAREYKKGGFLTASRKPSGVSSVSTPSRAKTLTLKEQSSTIERLSKENFDLKLKITFLSDRLNKLSEEGVKEMISENVELKTGLAVLQRDNKLLRRRVKELEKQLKDEDERPSTARSGTSVNGQSEAADQEAQEREEELMYLRERIEEYEAEVERLRNENMTKETDKRRMAEHLRSLQSVGEKHLGESMGRQEEADVWKDLLEQETAHREQVDEENRKLRDEIFRLKQEVASNAPGSVVAGSGSGRLHHTTNIYNITKHPRPASPSRPLSSFSGEMDGSNGLVSVASTLVEELRREGEQLRHENAELRREVGAQTSMLTSRNREKERLYQEIEDLKLAARRGGPAPSTIDSLLDRSASRAGVRERPGSRHSGGTRALTSVEDAEREEMDAKMSELRDKINELKLRNQDLQNELNSCTEDFETALEGKKQAEEIALQLQEDLENALNDLMSLQNERDEALQENDQLQVEFENLRKEAQDELDNLDQELEAKTDEAQKLQLDLTERTESFNALQDEMRKLSESLIGLEDEQENKMKRIQSLEQQLADANKELEELESKLLESNDKAQRLSVQQESGQDEIAFLREEQEGDKIRIGDLEASLAGVEQSLREEKERVRELDQRLTVERRQREIVANREKEEVQQFVNELNVQASASKDEARRLRKSLNSREREATEWKERLMELENNLREALGDLNGTRSSLLKSIAKLQRQLEDTVRELDTAKASVMEKDRIIKQRDALLESQGLEARKLADMLEKERQAHRVSQHQFETFQKTHQHVSRTNSSQEARIAELESAKMQDKRRISQLEMTFKEQLNERNTLLLQLWTRLSSLCGSDWAHDNSLINGRALPSLEAVATMLPGFSKNLLAAVKTIETVVGGFQGRVRDVERDLWREYNSLESALEARAKKLDKLESIVRNGVAAGTLGKSNSERELQARMVRLEDAYRQLKVENTTLRTAKEVRARAAASSLDAEDQNILAHSPSPSIPTGPRGGSRDRAALQRNNAGSRTRSSHGANHDRSNGGGGGGGGGGWTGAMHLAPSPRPVTAGELALAADDDGRSGSGNNSGAENGGGSGVVDSKWILRLRELENKLKTEREGRVQDRSAARERIHELEAQNRTQARESERRLAQESRGRQ
ncbi:hypothetical protein RB601_008204 [Gaeumannomyces tritici]